MTMPDALLIPPAADKYLEAALERFPLSLALIRALEASYLSQLQLPRPLLDLGCGDGSFAEILFQEKLDCGIDISGAQLRQCRRNGRYRFLVQSDIAQVPFRDRSFSTIFSNCVFEHLSQPQHILGELRRVLRDSGVLVFTTHTPLYAQYLAESFFWRRYKPLAEAQVWFLDRLWGHKTILTPAQWVAMLKDNGFRVQASVSYLNREATRFFGQLLPPAFLSYLYKRCTHRWIEVMPPVVKRRYLPALRNCYIGALQPVPLEEGACVLFCAGKV